MANAYLSYWSDEDLSFLIDLLEPDSGNRQGLMNALREDPEILEGMLGDPRLFRRLAGDPEGILQVSGRLFFAVLLERVRNDLRERVFTFENDNRYSVVVFDSGAALRLLDDAEVRSYLADMLASFARIGTRQVIVRVKPGVFRKVSLNDFDIESLIEYSRLADAGQRFLSYKRIADICLFLMGVFSDYLDARTMIPGAWFRSRSRKELAECGRYYYQAASREPPVAGEDMERVLRILSQQFLLAAKPLVYLSSRYLGFVRNRSFLS